VRLINSSARPASPKVLYVVPTWTWAGHTRIGGGLRAYLDRPWWSSGDEERLGVVLWQGPTSILQNDPPTSLRPFVSMWGFDPVYKSQRVPLMPTADSFPLATALGTDLSIQEVSGALVDVAGHDVGFDFDRGLWYCDIQVADPNGAELKSYMPFVRLALARYQPNSLADCHLSKVVLADFAQLTPTRAASVTGVGASRTVTVSGRASVGTERGIEPAIMRVTIEKRMSNVQDDALAWQTIGNIRGIKKTVNLTPTTLDGNLVIWSGPVKVPTSGGQYRLLIEEVETFHDGGLNIKTGLTTQERVVFTDVFPLNAVGT
jgi:hypothetical protein